MAGVRALATRRLWRCCLNASLFSSLGRSQIPVSIEQYFPTKKLLGDRKLLSRHSHVSAACFASEAERKCWSCGTLAPAKVFMLCPSCKAIQPAAPTNHFDVFQLERDYELDTSLLEKRYKDLQKKLHPDLFSMRSQKEQAYSADQASKVIGAYQTLLRPVTRATYLLETFGVDVEQEGTVNDPEVLMEVMEMQETVSECSDSTQLRQLQQKAKSRLKDYEKLFIKAMKRKELNAAKECVQRMSYFDRIINTITEKL